MVTELASHLPFKAMTARFAGILPRAIRTIRNERVSDHWKEKALLKLARRSLTSSVCIGGSIFCIVAVFIGIVGLLSLVDPPLWDFAMSVAGIVAASVAAVLYLTVRTHARSYLQRH
ncbi:MAG: hypothetical protein R3D05_05275 [Dongiaceae bacterium]